MQIVFVEMEAWACGRLPAHEGKMTDNLWRRNRGAGQISSNTHLEQLPDGVLARKAAARMLALPRVHRPRGDVVLQCCSYTV